MEEFEVKEKVSTMEFVYGYDREEELVDIISRYVIKFNNLIDTKFILNRLKKNGFNGLYILSDDKYEEMREDECDLVVSAGVYKPDDKIIILKESDYFYNKEIGCHELTHALIDGKLSKLIKSLYDSQKIMYGNGFEEGLALLSEIIDKDSNVNFDSISYITSGYKDNLCFILQLNDIYKYSKLNKYPNILYEAILNPDTFLNLIYRLYRENILNIAKKGNVDADEKELDLLSLRLANISLCVSDEIVDDIDMNNRSFLVEIAKESTLVNAIMIANEVPDIRNGENIDDFKDSNLSGYLKQLKLGSEERLLAAIFDSDINTLYFANLYDYLNKVYVNYINSLDSKPLSTSKVK